MNCRTKEIEQYSLVAYGSLILALFITILVLTYPVHAEETEFTVNFSANITDGYAPLPVQFTNLCTGNQESGNWSINGEFFEQLAGPEYTFIVPGSYNVSLTVTDDTNTTLTEEKIDYILVRSPLEYTVISFSGSGIWGTNPLLITDKSNGDLIFVGNTSSKNIQLNSTGSYSVQTLPGGWTDIFNAPDYGLAVIMDYVKNNLMGILIVGSILLIILRLLLRR